MERKQQSPNKINIEKDIYTQNFINQVSQLLLTIPTYAQDRQQQICKIVQNMNIINVNKIRLLLESIDISSNLITFSICSVIKLIQVNICNSNTTNKNRQINEPWQIISLCLMKIISFHRESSENSPITQDFLDKMVQKLISLLLLDSNELKLNTFSELFLKQIYIQEKPLKGSNEISVIFDRNQMIKFYSLVLCLHISKAQHIFKLTYILQRESRMKKGFESIIYKLQNWISKRQLSQSNIMQLLDLTIYEDGYFVNKRYESDKYVSVNINQQYRCLFPEIINQLVKLQKSQFKSKLLIFIVGKLCLRNSSIIPNVFKLCHAQTNKQVLQSVFDYLYFHYRKSISMMKMKALLQFFREQSSKYQQQQNSLSIFKLEKLTNMMSIFFTIHNYPLQVLDFDYNSNIILENVFVQQQTIVMFIQINKIQPTMEIISFMFGSKDNQKIHILLQINKQNPTIQKFLVIFENHKNLLFQNQIKYDFQSLNEFLIVIKFSLTKLEICINSSYMAIDISKLPFKKINKIQNLQLGKVKRKIGFSNTDFDSFIGRLKMFYIFTQLIQDIRYIYSKFNSDIRDNLDEFPNVFNKKPVLSINKGDTEKYFFNSSIEKRSSFIFNKIKYSQQRQNVFASKTLSMIEIVQQLQSYDLFLFLIYHLNQKLGQQGEKIICQILGIMKRLAIFDKQHNCVAWMFYKKSNDKQLLGLAHFLRLLFSTNKSDKDKQIENQNYKQQIVDYVLGFIFHFDQIEKKMILSEQKQFEFKIFRLQIIVKILLNFDIWGECSKGVQIKILKQVKLRLTHDTLQIMKTSMINHNIWIQIRKQQIDQRQRIQHKRNPNRILNGLLIILFLHNVQLSLITQNQPILVQQQNSNFQTQQKAFSTLSQFNFPKSMSVLQNKCIKQIRFQVIELINLVIHIQNNQQKLQNKFVSQIQLIFEHLIYFNSKQEFRNNSSSYLLLNYIYINIVSNSSLRFNQFFYGKNESPYYHKQHCLLFATLIQILPSGSVQSFRLILEIYKQLISNIQNKMKQSTNNGQISPAKFFVIQIIDAYKLNQFHIQPEYIIIIFNWIVQNNYGKQNISILCQAIKNKRKNIDYFKKLQMILLNMNPTKLLLLTTNPMFIHIIQTQNQQQITQKELLINNLYQKINQTNPGEANEFKEFMERKLQQSQIQEQIINKPSKLKQQLLYITEINMEHQIDDIDNNCKKAQQEWKRIIGKNLHWIEKGVPKGAIFKVDLHQCPNFYHLNIKVSKTSDKKGYPRRNQQKIQIEMKYQSRRRITVRDKSKSIPKLESTSPRSTVSPTSKKHIQSKQQRSSKIKAYYCQYVTQKGVYFGKLIYKQSQKQLFFTTVTQQQRKLKRQYRLSTSKYHQQKVPKSKTVYLNEQSVIFTRRYILRHTAFEIFTTNKSYFFNLFFIKQRDTFINSIKGVQKIINRRKAFIQKQFTKKWCIGKLNNFQYLMIVNRYSGRTFNDLAQYPVFPWVIDDYKGNNYMNRLRDLSLPVGKLNPQRFQGFKIRMQQGGFQDEQKFLYGTFYSNPTVLYNFFIRLQPFITLHWQHQGKKIDHADRLFSGIQEQYKSAINNSSDVKQLVPQFYYWPQFLRNRNQFQLGKKQKGQEVNDIVLPSWAKSPQQFVFKMRLALESEKVTKYLHLWIDLIFGVKSGRKASMIHDNLFHPLMYEMNSQADIFTKFQSDQQVTVAQLTISEFGQVPEAIFLDPHIQKRGRGAIKIDTCSEPALYRQAFKLLFFEDDQTKQAIIISKSTLFFINILNNYELNRYNTQLKLKSDAKINENQYLNIGYCIINGRNKIISRLVNGVIEIFSRDELKFYDKINSEVYIVTSDYRIIYGVNNKICVQKIDQKYKIINKKQKQQLSGHHDKIYKISTNEGIDILLSVDRGNLVLVHYLSSLTFLRQFALQLAPKQTVKQIRIHDMGYFLFFTSFERILIYTYFGEIFVQTDFTFQQQNQQVTNIQFISTYEPTILLSSSRGCIYMVSWFTIWKERQLFPYRPYNLTKLKKNKNCDLLHSCDNYKPNHGIQGQHIIDFYVTKSFYSDQKSIFEYSLIVLFKSGQLRIFSQRQRKLKRTEGEAIFKQIGIF